MIARVRNPAASARMLRVFGAVLMGLGLSACAPTHDTEAFYNDLQRFYVLTGGMRTERAPADAPFTNADLVRNFESIAFHTEFTDENRSLVAEKTPTTLVKWGDEVTYDIFGDAAGPEDERDLKELTDRVSELTGLKFRRVRRDPNVLILIANRGMREYFVEELEARGMGDRIQIIREWTRSDRFPCVGQVGETGRTDERRIVALIGIKGETKGLLRQSCIHEEFVQTMGLMNDDSEVRPSIFNDDQEFALLTAHDEYLLRILYDPRLGYGMTAEEGMPIVRQIVDEIGPGY